MLPYDQPYSLAVVKRYRVLAGPFHPHEAAIFASLTAHLKATGARITTVSGPHGGVEVWRLRSECETYDETANRLRRLKRR
jgi:hypothetical protein